MEAKALEVILVGCEATVRKLIAGGDSLLRWEWDERFGAALAVVKVPHHETVLQLVQRLFQHAWDHQNVDSAPEQVQVQADQWGGLESGQQMFVLEPNDDPLLFVAWWPWGSGTTFSLRLSCASPSGAAPASNSLALLRQWCGL
jgi:hypothetical protein